VSKSKLINISFFYLTLLITIIFPDLHSASAQNISNSKQLLSKTLSSKGDLLAETRGREFFPQNQLDISTKLSQESQENHRLSALEYERGQGFLANSNTGVKPDPEEESTSITASKVKQVRSISLSLFLLFFIPLGIFYPLFLFYRKLLGVEGKESDPPLEKNYKSKFTQPPSRKIFDFEAEENTPVATVSKLQIAFSPQALGLRQKLEQISSNDDLNQDQDIVDLMCKTVLALVSQQDWTHINYSSDSLPLEEVKAEFNLISRTERNKFITKELSLVNHNQQRNWRDDKSNYQDFYRYVVVTLVFCTTHNEPLFKKIHTEEQLIQVLGKLSKMRKDSLIQFELLWNPQQKDKYLSNDQLLMEYSDMIRLL